MIKNIIFDFGDVFINLDKEATAREMKKFGFENLTPEIIAYMHTYERGTISTHNFLDKMSRYFPKATTAELEKAWNAIIKDFPEFRLTFIEKLAKENDYELYLLSNTNELHIQAVKKSMGLERFWRFKSCFKKFYLSHEIGMRKPDSEIYNYVLEQNNLEADKSLFIDDSKENSTAAEAAGIHAWHLKIGEEDIAQLKRYLNHV